MHSLREIRRRVRSIGSTAQITRAMQMVAASKMRKAQEAALDGRPFAQLLYRIQREATRWSGDLQHPLLEVREVKLVATRFVNTLTQQPISLEFLPVGRITGLEIPGAEPEEALEADTGGCVFEPDAEGVLGYLLSHYLNIYIHQVLLNAKASEQSARMVSMKNATDSAEGLIKDLTREYNKLRQGNITKELLEIAGGQSD